MKTIAQLLGDDWCELPGCHDLCTAGGYCDHDIAVIVQRAREEMREAAAQEASRPHFRQDVSDAISALPVTP